MNHNNLKFDEEISKISSKIIAFKTRTQVFLKNSSSRGAPL